MFFVYIYNYYFHSRGSLKSGKGSNKIHKKHFKGIFKIQLKNYNFKNPDALQKRQKYTGNAN